MHSIKIFFEIPFVQNITSGIIGGLIVYFIQRYNDNRNLKKEAIQRAIVGKKDLKILSQDFMYQYEPEKITISKLIEEFGQPQKTFQTNKSILHSFEFQNAKIQIIENLEFNSINSITAFSKLNSDFPINCRLSYEENDEIMGKAKITDIIIRDNFLFKTINTPTSMDTIIGCHNGFKQTKHLNYFYLIQGNFDNIESTKGEIIQQVCVSNLSNSYSFFSFYDTFYG